jgi:hypothetical protein
MGFLLLAPRRTPAPAEDTQELSSEYQPLVNRFISVVFFYHFNGDFASRQPVHARCCKDTQSIHDR